MSAFCSPQFAVPFIAATPSIGFGSSGLGYGGFGHAYGSFGLGYHGADYGLGWAHAPAVAETSGSLGTLEGIQPSCINQIPSAEIVVQAPPVVMTIPGPILSATGKPVMVGGITPCAISGTGVAGIGLSKFGLGSRGLLGSKTLLGHRASIC